MESIIIFSFIMLSSFFDILTKFQLLFQLFILCFFLSSIWGSFKIPIYKFISSKKLFSFLHYSIGKKTIIFSIFYSLYYFIISWFLYSNNDLLLQLELQKCFFIGCINILLAIFIYKWSEFLINDYKKLTSIEETILTKQVLSWKPPPRILFDGPMKILDLMVSPKFFGLDNIPNNKPVLFVGNHALMGIDMPFLIYHLYKEKNIFLRGLADSFHFAVPIWGELLKYLGAVLGSRSTCSALMEANEHILVYPGGAHEVLKRKSDDKYELKWKQRTGFARLAIQHNYTIIPVCAVGTNEMLDIITDIPVGFVRKDLSVPVVKPPSPSQIQRIYFGFGKPIETSHLNKDTSIENCNHIRDECKKALENEIESIRLYQKTDPERQTVVRLKKLCTSVLTKQ